MCLLHKTMKFRHGIVKLVAPKLYVEMMTFESLKIRSPRPMTLFLKGHAKTKGLVGAEIGTAQGDNALNLLQELPIKKLFLIDPYTPYMQGGRQVLLMENLKIAKDRLGGFSQAVFIRKTADEAVEDMEEPLDFVYIDGNHDYEYVKNDIANYYPLVKKGGVIGGHDYVWNYGLGVCQAVNEFIEERGDQRFYAVFPDWWIAK